MQNESDRFYDPNSHIDAELRYQACQYSLFAFHCAKTTPYEVENGAPNSFITCTTDRRHLVYVRVTVEDEQEDGTGPMPGILIDLAREMEAEPHVVRVHLRSDQNGTMIDYFGHEELEKALKEGNYWRRALIGKRTARQYLALARGRLSKLELKVHCLAQGNPPRRAFGSSPDEKLLEEIFGKPTKEEEEAAAGLFPGHVFLTLSIDRLTPELDGHTISIGQLTRSAIDSGDYSIFSCSCGSPECAGIWRGVEVVHEDGLVVWRIRGIRPRRVVVFDRKEYRSEIFSKVRQALASLKEMGPKAYLGASDRRERLEEMLYRAEEEGNE